MSKYQFYDFCVAVLNFITFALYFYKINEFIILFYTQPTICLIVAARINFR